MLSYRAEPGTGADRILATLAVSRRVRIVNRTPSYCGAQGKTGNLHCSGFAATEMACPRSVGYPDAGVRLLHATPGSQAA